MDSDFISLGGGSSDEEDELSKSQRKFQKRITSKLGRIFRVEENPIEQAIGKRKRSDDEDDDDDLRNDNYNNFNENIKNYNDVVPESHLYKQNRAKHSDSQAPWLKYVDPKLLAIKRANPSRYLHHEIKAYLKYVSPTEQEMRTLMYTVQRVEKAIKEVFPNVRVDYFGSLKIGLYLPTSDIDMVVLGDAGNNSNDLNKLANHLAKTRIALNNKVQVIAKAKVPLVKFQERISEINFDISFNQPNGLITADLIKRFLIKNPSARALIIIIKQFLNMRSLNEVFLGGLSSYAISCLVISFLQMHPNLQAGVIREEENLGVLLIEFLELYGKNFNYNDVGISIKHQKYFNKSSRGWQKVNQQYLLSIEDPIDEKNDISVGSRNIRKIKMTLASGFDLITDRISRIYNQIYDPGESKKFSICNSNSILTSIIWIQPAIIKHRMHLSHVQELLREDLNIDRSKQQAKENIVVKRRMSNDTDEENSEERYSSDVEYISDSDTQ